MAIAYGIGGIINVPQGALTGNGPPPASFKGQLGQFFFDKSQLTPVAYVFNGNTWTLAGVSPEPTTTASPTATVTSSARVATATFTGFTTAAAATQSFTITNPNVLTTSGLLVTVTNLNASGNNASMGINGIRQANGSFIVDTVNNGAGALGAGDNVLITYWILS